MAGLGPAIHVLPDLYDVDARDERGHDGIAHLNKFAARFPLPGGVWVRGWGSRVCN